MAQSRVGELMTKNVIAARDTDSLETAFQIMIDNNVRHVPVVNDEDELVGVISERDLLRITVDDDLKIAVTEQGGQFLADVAVQRAMSVEPETASEDMALADACQTMLDNKFDCLPVVRGQSLIGILTTADIVREMIRREAERENLLL